MAWKQVVNANFEAPGRKYYCLEYADKVFGRNGGSDTAKHSWQLALGRGTAHADRNLPNVAVPVYFSWVGNLGEGRQDYGHVVVYNPNDGKFYSTKFDSNGHRTFNSIDEIVNALPGQYLGWAEEIDTTRVAQFEADPIANAAPGFIQPASGKATVTVEKLNVRNSPSTSSPAQTFYLKGQTFNFTGYVDSEGRRWLTYLNGFNVRRYIAQGGSDGSYVSIG